MRHRLHPDADHQSAHRTLSRTLQAGLRNGLALLKTCLAQQCLLCGATSADEPVCPACLADLPALPPHCPRCAMPSAAHETCGSCLARPPRYDRTIAAWAYAFPADRLVQALKYQGRLQLARWFASQLANRLDRRPDLIIPVPLHRSRLRERGFNQAQEIARALSRLIGAPLASSGIGRVRPTPAQASLAPAARVRNVRGAFQSSLAVQGRRIAVVDDVMTTGATLDEVARVLKRAGAVEVTNVVAARTLKDQ